MILVGNSIFSYNDYGCFMTNNNIGTPTEVSIKDSVVDELYIKTDTSTEFSTDKESWQSSTIIKAPFIDDLHGGNMNLKGLEITELRFKKRKVNSVEWIQFATLPFNPEQTIYSVDDNIVESYETYEYGVSPYSSSVEGDTKTGQITTEFYDCFIFDKTSNYKLEYNVEMDDIVFNAPSSVMETLSGKYPTVTFSSDLNYRTGSIKCLLATTNTIEDGIIDATQEKIYRNNLSAFLTNKKPKIFKDNSGNMMVVSIKDFKLSPNNNLNRLMFKVNMSFTEIGDGTDYDTLVKNGFINV